MTTTEQFLLYLVEKRRFIKAEGWYMTYEAWRWIRGYSN